MKKTIVIFYSNKGSNRYLAKRISENLNCEIEEIKPKIDAHLFLLFGLSFGNKKPKINLAAYDRVVLCGPIWMGKFIAPLKGFVKKHINNINELVFATCCGSSFDMKDKKFGHGLVFKEIKEMLKGKCIHCEAFPITLVIPDDNKENPDTVMKTRLTDDNFKGEILNRFNDFIKKISA